MKRDFDLMRDILLNIEGQDDRFASVMLEDDKTCYHIELLMEEGLIKGNIHYDYKFSGNLTSKGHDFLNNIKNDNVWNKLKQFILEKGSAASFQIIVDMAANIAKKHFGL